MKNAKPKKDTKRKGRRARGTGSIFFSDKKQRWVGRLPIGRSPAGRTVYRECWGETQVDVIEAMKNSKPPGPETTVSTWAAKWLDTLTVRLSTKDDYEHTITAFVLPSLGHHRVGAVTAPHVEHAAKQWSAKLGPNTLRKCLSHLRILFAAAHRAGLVITNPVDLAKKPKSKKVDIMPFSTDELGLIIAEAAKYPTTAIVAILASLGCRIGEALALNVEDFDEATGKVSITKTFSLRYGIGPPKSVHSTRIIRVPLKVVPLLRAAMGGRKNGPVFVDGSGNRRPESYIRFIWKKVLRKLGLPHRNPHQLRHSVATALISASVPLGDVAVFLGDTVETIVKTYLHSAGTDPADTLDRLLGGCKVDTPKRKSKKSRET